MARHGQKREQDQQTETTCKRQNLLECKHQYYGEETSPVQKAGSEI